MNKFAVARALFERLLEAIAVLLIISLAVVVVIPLSLLATFMGLKIMGVPANLLSLGAMDFGIIVDGAVIMIENIMHRLAERGEKMDERDRRDTIIEAASEVGRPTLFSMLIIIAAHIPIFALQRHEGRIFQPMALSVTMAPMAAPISVPIIKLSLPWRWRRLCLCP